MNQIRPLKKGRQILASSSTTLTFPASDAIPRNQVGIAGREIVALACGSHRRHRGKQMAELCSVIADPTSNPQAAPGLRWHAEPSLTSSVESPLFDDIWRQMDLKPNALFTMGAQYARPNRDVCGLIFGGTRRWTP